MRALGLIGTLISLAIVGYVVMSRLNIAPSSQSAKDPTEIRKDLMKLPGEIQLDLEKKMKERMPSNLDD